VKLNRADELNRSGERGGIPFRSGRVFNADGKWFFFVRGGSHKGPFELREEAEDALSLFVNNGFLANQKAVVRAYFDDLWSCGDFSRSQFLVDGSMQYHAQMFQEKRDRDWLFQFVKMARIAVPDLSVEIDELIEEGNKIAASFAFVGTHTNDFMGIKATQKTFRAASAEIFHLQYDKIVSIHSFANYSQIVSEALRISH